MLNFLKSPARNRAARALYDEMVARARAPVFFRDFGVADTIDGRFDLLALHAWLMLDALRRAGRMDEAQSLTNVIFTGFDEALREQGAGDMGLSRRVKAMADAFFGRLQAYDKAVTDDALAAALARNLYRGAAPDAKARAVAAYARSAQASLTGEGVRDFGPLPETP